MLADGTTKETVEVKRLTVRQLYRFVELTGGKTPTDAVAMCCGKPAEWVDTLSDESFIELAAIVHKANFPRAMAMAEKGEGAMACAIAPYVGKLLAASGMAGKEKSQSSPSLESVGEMQSESLISLSTGLIS